jgi:phosphoribosylformylglycinamidine synthase
VQETVRDLIRSGLVKSAHDCSEGGLAVALAESCFNPEQLFGAEIDLGAAALRRDQLLFNESQSRIVISVAKENADATLTLCEERRVSAQQLGKVASSDLVIRASTEEFRWPIAEIYDDWFNAIRRAVEDNL